MSQSATIGGWRKAGARNARSMIAPPSRNVRRNVRRGSIARRRAPATCRRVAHESSRHGQARDQRSRARDLRRGHLREILGLQDFGRRHRETRIEIERRRGFRLVLRRLEQSVGDAVRARLRLLFLLPGRIGLRRHHRDQFLKEALALPENAKRLIEQKGMFVLLDEHRVKRRVEIALCRRSPPPRPPPRRRARRPARPAGPLRAARARNRGYSSGSWPAGDRRVEDGVIHRRPPITRR